MNIGIVVGGISSEREISFKIGNDILNNIDSKKYKVKLITIDSECDVHDKLKNIDFAFLALAGEFGEDGRIQSILDSLSIPYNGSGYLTSCLCMDKNVTKIILNHNDIYTPNWILIKNKKDIKNLNIDKFKFPLIVKPNSGGSSIGVFKVNSYKELLKAVENILELDKKVIVEEFIDGDEYSSFILDGYVYPSIYINLNGDMFSYSNKYNKDIDKFVGIANYDIENRIKDLSLKLWKIFDCDVYLRVDIIIKNNELYILELNTLPFIREGGLVHKIVQKKGMSLTDLIDKIIDISLKK